MEDAQTVRRMLQESLEAAMNVAQDAMHDLEAVDMVALAEMALRGQDVVQWRPAGLARLVCPRCGPSGDWFQSVRDGTVKCGCELRP